MKKIVLIILISFAAGYLLKAHLLRSDMSSTITIDHAAVSYQQHGRGTFAAGESWKNVRLISGNYRVSLLSAADTEPLARGRLSFDENGRARLDLKINTHSAASSSVRLIDIRWQPTRDTDIGKAVFD